MSTQSFTAEKAAKTSCFFVNSCKWHTLKNEPTPRSLEKVDAGTFEKIGLYTKIHSMSLQI